MNARLPSVGLLQQAFLYSPECGVLIWREREASDEASIWQRSYVARWNRRYAGKHAGTDDRRGRIRICLSGTPYLAHRIIWKLVTGEEPAVIDHLNGDPSDNRFANLRNVDQAANSKNSKIYNNNRSGRGGVIFDRARGKWRAEIKVGGKAIFLGRFSDFHAAERARELAEQQHGFTSRHGRPS